MTHSQPDDWTIDAQEVICITVRKMRWDLRIYEGRRSRLCLKIPGISTRGHRYLVVVLMPYQQGRNLKMFPNCF